MADFEFRIVDGPYQGTYAIDASDISASDVGDLLAQGGPDLDEIIIAGEAKGVRMFAGLVWLARRRMSSKGLAYRAVADAINFKSIDTVDDDAKESAEKSDHPSTGVSD